MRTIIVGNSSMYLINESLSSDIFALDHNSGPKNSTEAATMVEQVQTVCGKGEEEVIFKQNKTNLLNSMVSMV